MDNNQRDKLSPSHLSQFSGSTEYTWGAFRAVLMTEGTTHISANGAGWLIDAIGSHIMANAEFKAALKADPDLAMHFWTLKRDPDNAQGAILTANKDSGTPDLVRQVIEYTDFPLDLYPDGFKLYAGLQDIGGNVQKFVIMLPSEY